MFVQIVSLLDLACGLLIYLAPYVPGRWILYAALYLAFKGFFFGYAGDFISWLDFAVGIYLFIVFLGASSTIISLICFLYLLQKAVISFIR